MMFADVAGLPVHSGRAEELRYEGVRVLTGLHVQVDCQLEIRRGGDIPQQAVLIRVDWHASDVAIYVRRWSMVETFRLDGPRGDQQLLHSSVERGASSHCSQSDTRLYPDLHPLSHPHRLPLCEKLALPVLRLHHLVDAVLAVAEWDEPGVDICRVHGAGVGMECVSQHKRQFDGGCCLFGSDCRKYMDTHKSIRRSQDGRSSAKG